MVFRLAEGDAKGTVIQVERAHTCSWSSQRTDNMAAAGMRFCRECNNMLYPSQDRELRRLMFRCRNCGQAEEVEENCIYVNELVRDTRVQLDVLPADVIDDPTLQRDDDVVCPNCGHNGAVFIRSQDGVKQSTLQLIWVCLNRDCQVDEEGNRLPSYRWMG